MRHKRSGPILLMALGCGVIVGVLVGSLFRVHESGFPLWMKFTLWGVTLLWALAFSGGFWYFFKWFNEIRREERKRAGRKLQSH